MTAVPMTAIAVGTTSGYFAVKSERDATARLQRLASTASDTHEWRCLDVGSDDSRPIRIARVEACVVSDVSAGPDRKSRALLLTKREKFFSIALIGDKMNSFVAFIRDEANFSREVRCR